MPNINDLDPSDISQTAPAPASIDAGSPAPSSAAPISGNIFNEDPSHIESSEDHFGTPGQQLLAGAEGVAQGVLGPIAPAIEEGLGLTTGENIRARQSANPITHGAGEATGFVGSLATGLGEASLAGQVGNIGEHAAALLPALAPKLAVTGIKASAEMAALAATSELSKLVEQDPGQTLGSAAINVGLSGIIGGAGGVALGTISPLWNKAKNIIGVEKLATDFMAETAAIKSAGDPVASATSEINGRLAEADQILNGGLKGQAIAKTLPQPTPENVSKIDEYLLDISNKASKRIAEAGDNAYLKGATSKLEQDLKGFNDVITNPETSIQDKWDALDDYKRASQGHANYNILTGGAEEKALSKWIKPFNASLREAAENPNIWGEAGNIQRDVNKAAASVYEAQKDFLPKVTSKELGERIADPNKLKTLLTQTGKGNGGLRANAVKNYLEATQEAADVINRVHIENGLEAPLESKLNPTPVVDHALNTPPSPGVNLARWVNQKGAQALGNSAGEAVAGGVGGALGALVGHPIAGAFVSERLLGPIFKAFARPLAETAVSSAAARGTVEYLGNAIKGQQALENSVSGLFGKGAEVIAKDMIPDQESRDKLEKSLNHMSVADNAMNVGGSLGHYLPQHAMAAAQTAAQASSYLNSLKPKQPANAPLDSTPPIDKMAQSKYNRALDIAQQPLMVIKHTKDGTLQKSDVDAIRAIYPSTHDAIIQKVSNGLIDHKSKDLRLPYAQRQSMNLLVGGNPLDSTMSPQAAQAIMMSSHVQQAGQQQKPGGRAPAGHASASTLSQINKANSQYATPLQAREADRRK